MLSKPIYEALPYGYLLLGGLAISLLDSAIAQSAGIVLFLAGSKIYSLRSDNRRTDLKSRRKKGIMPRFIYEHMPTLYLLGALLVLKLEFTHSPVISLVLVSYAAYLALRRSQYRKHKIVKVEIAS